jgi:DHA1 family multidrug resistance protein-like MFS transporter
LKSAWARLLVLFTVVSLIEAVFYGSLSAFIPLHLPDLGIARADVQPWVGAITAFASLVGIPLVPIWGTLADRISRKFVIVRSFVIHLVATIVMLAAPNVWVFAAGRALLGFANGDTALMLASMAERAPAGRLGFAFAVINSSLSVGAFTGALAGGPIVDRFGFNTLLAGIGVMLFGVVIALMVGYRETPRTRTSRPILTLAIESVRIITRSPALLTLFVAQFAVGTGWMLVFTYAPLVVTSFYAGPDPGTTVGIVMAVGGLGTLLLGPLIGSTADRVGYWRALLAVVTAVIGLWMALTFVRDLGAFIPLWAVLNGVMSSVSSLAFNIVSNVVDDDARSRIMAFAYLPLNFGSFVGPALGSAITGISLYAIFPAAAVCVAIGLLLFLRARTLARMPASA